MFKGRAVSREKGEGQNILQEMCVCPERRCVWGDHLKHANGQLLQTDPRGIRGPMWWKEKSPKES